MEGEAVGAARLEAAALVRAVEGRLREGGGTLGRERGEELIAREGVDPRLRAAGGGCEREGER